MTSSLNKAAKKQPYSLFYIVCLLCFILSSCSHHNIATTMRSNNLKTYTGPVRSKDSVGYLFCSSNNLVIDAIDSLSIPQLKAQTHHQGNFTYIELFPGQHSIVIKGQSFHTAKRGFHPNQTVDISSQTVLMRGKSELSFVVQPGHVYIVNAHTIKNKTKGAASSSHILTIYVKDASTKEIITKVDYEIRK